MVAKRTVVMLLAGLVLASCSSNDWRTASREPAGIATPASSPEAVIEVFAADAYGWRGIFAVHTWIAVKPAEAREYTVYEVVGWRVERGQPALYSYQTPTPDRYWYGARPEKLLSLRGAKAAELIPRIADLSARYPWANEYTAVPGPNSNTFPAWIGQQIPELGLELPFRAIGSGYID